MAHHFWKRTCRDCGVGAVKTYQLGPTRCTYCTHPACRTQTYNITYVHKTSTSWRSTTPK
jgi:ribosomal protein L37E